MPEESKTNQLEAQDGETLTIKSLCAQAQGIEPLIIGVFLIVSYWLISAIAYFISWAYGRL